MTTHDHLQRTPTEDLLRNVIDTTPAFLHSSDPDGKLGFFNRRWLEYLGANEEDLQGWGWTNFIHPEDLQEMLVRWQACRTSGEVFQHESRIRRADGQYLWFLHRMVPEWDAQGNILTWYGSSIEIDDRVHAEQELKKAFAEIKILKDQLQNENLALKEEIDQASMFEEIVGASDAIKRILTLLSKVAPTDSTVLITGETGTGKELAARAIHKRSRRAQNAFVAVNCAAIPPSLVASDLFGHEKGAFTGATQRRLGRFEVADGGTIFSTKWGTFRPRPRSPCSGCCRSTNWNGWAPPSPSQLTCGSLPPPTATLKPPLRQAHSGATCSTG